ncbi:MAG: hypothetical protein ACSW8F_00095 [bacterium]
MAKKQPPKPSREVEENYYKLHTKAVDDLVTANEQNSPPVSEAELRKYRSGPKFKLAGWFKMLFIKFWFTGAVCFFFLWGLGLYVSSMLDMLVITGIALGIVTDLLTNNALRFFASYPGENDRYMMFPQKAYSTFFLNIFYSYVLLFLVFTLYMMINSGYAMLSGSADAVVLGVEPILFGLFYLFFDVLLIGMKQLLFRIVADAKNKNRK